MTCLDCGKPAYFSFFALCISCTAIRLGIPENVARAAEVQAATETSPDPSAAGGAK